MSRPFSIVLSTLILAFTVTAPAFGQCPTATTLTAPSNGARQASPVELRWTPAPGAEGYTVLGARADGVATTLGTTTDSRLIVNLPPGPLAWTVQANRTGCEPATAEPRLLQIIDPASNCPTAGPTPLSPAAGQQPVSPLEFRWTAVDGAKGYRLFVAGIDSPPRIVGATSATSLRTSLDPGDYVWWVQAVFESCPATTSAPIPFRVVTPGSCASSPPALRAPASGASALSSPVTFEWTAVQGAAGYRLWIGPESGTPAPVAQTASTTATVPLPPGSAVWFVEAFFERCPSEYSERRPLAVSTGGCPTTAPTLVTPAEGAAGLQSPVSFLWNGVPGAIGYRLWIQPDGSEPRLLTATPGSDTSADLIVPSGTNSWFVEALFRDCPPTRSASRRFSAGGSRNCPDGTAAPLTPANGADSVASPVTFSWSPAAGASSYRVWIAVEGATPIAIGSTTGTTLTRAVPAGAIVWFVETLFADCPSTISSRSSFRVARAGTCETTAPSLTTPAGGSTSSNPVGFTWSPVPGALGYKVWVSRNGSPFGDLGLTASASLTRSLPAGEWAWFVESFFAGCPSTRSGKRSFRIEEAVCSPPAASLNFPTAGASVSSPLELSWSEVPGARTYRVWAAADGADLRLVGETLSTSLRRTLPPGTYRWLVEATFGDCPPVRTALESFVIPARLDCGTTKMELLSPPAGSIDIDGEIEFLWSAVTGAGGYGVWVVPANGRATLVGTTEFGTSLRRRLPPGDYEWFVTPFVSGCQPAPSSRVPFRVDTPAGCDVRRPMPIAPRDGTRGVPTPTRFIWTAVPGASRYDVWANVGNGTPSIVGSSTSTELSAQVPAGLVTWYVEAIVADCPPIRSVDSSIFVSAGGNSCAPPAAPLASSVGRVASGKRYPLFWSPQPNAGLYEVEESTSPDFATASTTTVSGLRAEFVHVVTQRTDYYYRVRALGACDDRPGLYSRPVRVVVTPPPPSSSGRIDQTTPIGSSEPLVQTVFIPGSGGSGKWGASGETFTASTTEPWMTVSPSSGTIPPGGTTVTVTTDPSALPPGTSTGSVQVTTTSTTTATPVAVNVASPVAPIGKQEIPGESLIFPAVAHAEGLDSLWQSDLRVTNTSAASKQYDLYYTPSGLDGTTAGARMSLTIEPGRTVALNDVLSSYFGEQVATGTLEVRPLTSSASTTLDVTDLVTIGSSRTYNQTANGTFGQFIPAVPFSRFTGLSTSGAPSSAISLQQVSQSASYRTNIGMVEASGKAVTVRIRVYDPVSKLVDQFEVLLDPNEHLQLNSELAARNIQLDDGRIEMEVAAGEGRITGYASVVDNRTGDPRIVLPARYSTISSTKYVLPGIADLDNGVARWRSDVRMFNGGSSEVVATVRYYPLASSTAAATKEIAIAPGEMKILDDVLRSTFNLPNSGGAFHIETAGASSLVITARTYDDRGEAGTFGQFIPAIESAAATGLGDRPLQVLQIEESEQFRSNLGIAEVDGKDATVEISAVVPGSTVAPKLVLQLKGNEFLQLTQVLKQMGLGTTYNARLSIKVTSGSGRITAYGSVIDNLTQDPTYVPAQ